jgi:hypothetical protein
VWSYIWHVYQKKYEWLVRIYSAAIKKKSFQGPEISGSDISHTSEVRTVQCHFCAIYLVSSDNIFISSFVKISQLLTHTHATVWWHKVYFLWFSEMKNVLKFLTFLVIVVIGIFILGFSAWSYINLLFNPSTPELNPSAQRCLPIFYTGILIFKSLTARRVYESFGVKGLFPSSLLIKIYIPFYILFGYHYLLVVESIVQSASFIDFLIT